MTRHIFLLLSLLLCVIAQAQIESVADDAQTATIISEIVSERVTEESLNVSTYLNEMLSLYQKHYTTNSPQYADCVMWCAMMCAQAGDGKQAKALLKKSCQLYKAVGTGPFDGRDTLHEILRLDVATLVEDNDGREYYSVKYAKKSCKLKCYFFGETSENYLKALLDLSRRYAERLNKRKSRLYHNIGYNSYVELIKREFCEKSESERTMYWNTAVKYINKTLDVAYKTKSQAGGENSMPAAAYDALLLSKGLLLNTTLGYENYIQESGNEIAIRNLKLKKDLASKNVPLKTLDSLDYVILEALKDAGQTYTIPHLSVNWHQVQEQLGEDDLSVEFFRNTKEEYAAVLLRKGMKTPVIVTLGKFVKHDRKLAMLNKLLQSNPIENYNQTEAENLWQFGRAIWTDEFLKYFPVTDSGRVFFSADGELLVTGIEYLPFLPPKKSGSAESPYYCISDYYHLYRLSSTRELVMQKEQLSSQKAIVYGGLFYNMPMEDLIADAQKQESSKKNKLAYAQNGQMRGERGAATGIPYLKGTATEADSIISILDRGPVQSFVTTYYNGNAGTEATFKALSGKRINILHLATHGFFFEENDTNFKRFALGNNPLVRNGLYLAGADNKWFGESIPESVDDGFLTSLEIAGLDFRGLDIVVLSACETGKGNISGDGVFGLQRGFKMAGANSILMSLWKVDDEATCLLMTEFYKNWLNGMSKNEALRVAKNVVRSHSEKGWDNPKYWAAFILLDGLD